MVRPRCFSLLNKMSYGDLTDDLSSVWRKADAPQKSKTDDGCWVHTLQIVFEELEALGLSEPVPKPALGGQTPTAPVFRDVIVSCFSAIWVA